MTDPLLINSPTAARMLCISQRTLWSLTDVGEIPVIRIGRAVRYSPADLQAWIDRTRSTSRDRTDEVHPR